MARSNIKLLLEYDGTPYAGWQRQAGLSTVQGTVEAALAELTQAPPPALMCAGRTDAGVHALGQVVNFRTDDGRPPGRWAAGLNHFLPPSIRVHRAEAVPLSFDARLSARSKVYRYRIYVGPHPPALDARRVWHSRRPLAVAPMRAAAAALVGEHDFESFRSVHCDAGHARRRIFSIEIAARPQAPGGVEVQLHFHANAFCRHMCRILAGTLAEVGWGRRSPADIPAVLTARRRTAAGVTAPPWGLVMCAVLY